MSILHLALTDQHEGIGTFKMRSMSHADPSNGAEHGATGLLQSARAALTRPLGGNHKMEPVPHGAPLATGHDDNDSESEEVLVDDGLSSDSSSDEDEFEDAMDGDEHAHFHDTPSDLEHVVDVVSSDERTSISSNTRPSMHHAGTSTDTSLASHHGKPHIDRHASKASSVNYFDRVRQDSPEASLSVPQTPASFAGLSSGAATPSGTRRRNPFKRGSKDKSHSSGQEQSELGSATPGATAGKRKVRRKKKRGSKEFEFDAEGQRDILGIVVIEIKSASDLPRLKNGQSA